MMLIGGLLFLSQQRLKKTGIETQGEVVEYRFFVSEPYEDSFGNIAIDEGYRRIIEYTDSAGNAHRFESSKSFDSPGVTGLPVAVVYDPKNPANVATSDELEGFPWALGIFVAGMLAAAGGGYGIMRGGSPLGTPETAVEHITAKTPPLVPSPLDAYVTQARASGQDDATIRRSLTDAGWDKAEIDRSLPSSQVKA